jgi:dihydroorotate dehydrogenase
MPDWFYRTVTQPILFRLSAERARNLALGFMGILGRLPLGGQVIDLLGHMRADPRLARERLGMRFPSPVGIGPALDGRAVALPALARFGIGFLEIGPVTLAGGAGVGPIQRRADQQALWCPEPSASLSLDEALARLREIFGRGVPLVVHVDSAAGADPVRACVEIDHLLPRLAEVADILVLADSGMTQPSWTADQRQEYLRRALAVVSACSAPRPVLIRVSANLKSADTEHLVASAVALGAAGILVEGCIRDEASGRLCGLPALALVLQQVRTARLKRPEITIIASGSVHEPEQALELLQAGADLVSTDTGLIYTGPGLPKRINEAVLYAQSPEDPGAEVAPAPEQSWFWGTLMGAGMLLGSILALIVAATRVVLPYDENFVGMSRAELNSINPRLLSFLTHDRVSLAGTMIAKGILYVGLALFGIRRGFHWARQTVLISAFIGFLTYFLFLGYGYLDPFHAFVTAILFQFLLLSLHCRLGPAAVPDRPQLSGDWRWRLSLWGQLILIGHACAVLGAGVVICSFGVTRVFVPEDLAFMHTTAEALRDANPRILPLVAHDRATFGGMLVSAGTALLLTALWGFRPCSIWLWWTQLLAVSLAYLAALAVHMAVGYTDHFHLTPVYLGLPLFWLALGLSYPFLCRPGSTAEEWKRFRGEP